MNKWLKIGAVVLVALLGVVSITGIVLAQGPVDTDGTCDTCDAELGQGFGRGRQFDVEGDTPAWGWRADGEAPCGEFVDEDGDGVCDHFVDEDGDGVCDLFGTGAGTRTASPEGNGLTIVSSTLVTSGPASISYSQPVPRRSTTRTWHSPSSP